MSKHIAAFGEVMMRLQVPGYELLSQADQLKYTFSGSGVNVVAALTRFRHTGSVVTTLPNNSLGNAATAHLQKLGISKSFIQKSGKYIGLYFLENGFGVRPSQVTYSNRLESSFNTGTDDLYNFKEIAKKIDAVHFCGITLAMNDSVRQQMKAFAKAVKEQGGHVIFDCNYRPSLWGAENGYEKARPHYEEMLHYTDIVMMNEKDAMFVLGEKTDREERREQLVELMPIISKKYNIDTIAGTHRTVHENNTHSLRGFMYRDQVFTFSENRTFQVLDRIGAGDAYASGIIHGKLRGFSPRKTVEFATTASMLAHTIIGDTPLSTESDILSTIKTKENTRDIER